MEKVINGTLDIHYYQLPEGLFISLNKDFHKKFCLILQKKIDYKFKNCFHKILNCPKWHAARLFTRKIRFTIKELEKLRKFIEISEKEIENNIETLGNHEDGTIIKNPKLPFNLKDIFYVASHLIFDGSFRLKKGCYFYAFEQSLVSYHKKRLNVFGEVPINFIKKENQLYFSYTIGYIASKILEIDNFGSTKCILSSKFKLYAFKYKLLADEVIKALIIDEGDVSDRIRIELANQKLVEDLCEIFRIYYNLTNIISRTRYIKFYNNKKPFPAHVLKSWKFGISASSFKDLYKSINPLPINYKENNFIALGNNQNRKWLVRKTGETKKMIVKSLIGNSKSVTELANDLVVGHSTIRRHLNGHSEYSDSLIKLNIIKKSGERILKKGGYAKENIFSIKDINKAENYLER